MSTTNAVGPTKTKAKSRYLKKKKERKKQRAKAEEVANARKEHKVQQDDSESSEDEQDVEVEEVSVVEEDRKQSSPAPRKRQKLESTSNDNFTVQQAPASPIESEDVEMAGDVEHDGEDDEDIVVGQASDKKELELPFGTLPSFPLPSHPHAPSKSTLALQGLDRHIIEADIVHPSTVLPIPIGDADEGGTRLSEKTRRQLKDIGITELFAVQTALIPYLIPKSKSARNLYRPFDPPSDVCVSAPTGSGKTLAYVLPILELLQTRIVTRLRALVVLPTRDLVVQVRETFEALNKGRGLKIGSVTGQQSFTHEQSQLVHDKDSNLLGGSSRVDILICTPGRLMDHLLGTPNFSLQHLRFLVVDEADRLLAQSFQDWLSQVLAAIRSPKKVDPEGEVFNASMQLSNPHPDGLSPNNLQLLPVPDVPTFLHEHPESSCQKLLFSATLTRDPGKIAMLELRNPKYVIVQGSGEESKESNVLKVMMERFAMPETLKEHMIVTDSLKKPLVMFHLVHSRNVTNALVFTKSAESTTRLLRLFDFFEEARVAANPASEASPVIAKAYSSDLSSQERKSILEEFKAQKINILICSDLISRGMDISHVSHVVSYDVPVDIRKYVHRVGRTARAGREGDAWTLVEEQEARHFKRMLSAADHLNNVKRVRIPEKAMESLMPYYESALANLRKAYARQQ